MRISTKLSLAVGASTFLVMGVAGVVGARAAVDTYEADVRRDQRAMAMAVGQAIEHVAERGGAARAHELVDDLNERSRNVEMTWLEDELPPEESTTRVVRSGPDPLMITEHRILARTTASTLRIVESLRGEREVERDAYARAAVTATLAALISALVMSLLGAAFVTRPLRALGTLARRLGEGDLGARAEIARGDEIGVLAHEMNAMGAQLERARTSLAEASAARVGILEQLRHADRLRVLGEIGSELAHQIGTPLAAVRTRAQLIAGEDLGADRTRDAGRAIVADVDRVSATVRHMLDFARRPAGKKEELELGAWLDQALDVLRPLVRGRELTLVVEHAETPLRACIRSIEMQQVLTNLVMNAVHASSRGHRITVRIGRDGDSALITVADEGGGIAEDALPRVFEPYYTTKDAGEGTGLGLSVAHGIVREHGGSVDIESRLRHGTTVMVRIPLEHAAAPAADGKASWKARVRTAAT